MSNLMKLIINPLLTIEPGHIAGRGGAFKIAFSVVQTQNLSSLIAKYEILHEAGYRFQEPEITDPEAFYTVKANGLVADGFMDPPGHPKQGRWSQKVYIEQDPGFAGTPAAALKIGAEVKGRGTGTLGPALARGSIAILSGGLTKLVDDYFETHAVPPGITDFEGRAREFVRVKQAELKGKFKSFDDLDPRTIVNAILGKTNPQKNTVDSLKGVIAHFRQRVTFPPKFTATGANEAQK